MKLRFAVALLGAVVASQLSFVAPSSALACDVVSSTSGGGPISVVVTRVCP